MWAGLAVLYECIGRGRAVSYGTGWRGENSNRITFDGACSGRGEADDSGWAGSRCEEGVDGRSWMRIIIVYHILYIQRSILVPSIYTLLFLISYVVIIHSSGADVRSGNSCSFGLKVDDVLRDFI